MLRRATWENQSSTRCSSFSPYLDPASVFWQTDRELVGRRASTGGGWVQLKEPRISIEGYLQKTTRFRKVGKRKIAFVQKDVHLHGLFEGAFQSSTDQTACYGGSGWFDSLLPLARHTHESRISWHRVMFGVSSRLRKIAQRNVSPSWTLQKNKKHIREVTVPTFMPMKTT